MDLSRTFAALVVAAACSAAPVAIHAQSPGTAPPPTPANGSTLQPADQQFVTQAAEGGNEEVDASRIAEKRGVNSAVKTFAARMVRDHTKVNGQLMAIARRKGMTVNVDRSQYKPDLDHLNQLSGKAFDSAYIDAQVGDHQKTISLFEQESQSGTDPDLKDLATKTLPTLRDHLKMAQDAQTKVNAEK